METRYVVQASVYIKDTLLKGWEDYSCEYRDVDDAREDLAELKRRQPDRSNFRIKKIEVEY